VLSEEAGERLLVHSRVFGGGPEVVSKSGQQPDQIFVLDQAAGLSEGQVLGDDP
jgi:hypothetical protein